MRRWFRQGGAVAGQISHHGLRLIGTLLLVLLLLAGAAAWRLSRGPVDLPPLASRIGAAATNAMPGSTVTIGAAALAWEGFNRGGAPIDLRLSDITVIGPQGVVAARLSRLRITLSPVLLLRGQIAPIDVIARHTHVRLQPESNPSIPAARLDLADIAAALGRLIGSFGQVPHAGGLDLTALRIIRISHAHLILDDTPDRLALAASDGTLTLVRDATGDLHGSAHARFHHHGVSVPVAITITGADGLGSVRATLGPTDPAQLAPDQPALARVDLPVTLTARWPIGRKARARLALTLRTGAGHLRVAGSTVAIAAIEADISATPTIATLDHATITLAAAPSPSPGAANPPGPTAILTGSARLTGTLPATIDASIDHVTAADLPADWPPALARDARRYVVRHVLAGTARNGHFHARFTLDGPGHQPRLDHFAGGFTASGVTLDWFKHAIPMTGLAGTLDFIDQDILIIKATSGQLGGLGLSGTMTISQLTHHDQMSLIAARLSGPAAAAVPLLDAPPLRLNRRGVNLAGTTGQLTAGIDASLPLKKHLKLADVTLAAAADLRSIHLPLPIAGLAFDDGTIALSSTLHHLALHGSGQFVGQAADFAATMTLPGGMFNLTAHTRAGRALLARLGASPGLWRHGAAPLAIRYQDRNGDGALDLTADLTPLTLALPALAWRKPAGQPGHAAIALTLRNGKPAALRSIDITAPSLALRGTGTGGAVQIETARLGGTAATGKLTPPPHQGAPWRLALAGNTLDLAAILHPGRNPTRPTTPPAAATTTHRTPDRVLPWQLRAAFDHTRLDAAPSPALGPAQIEASGNGATVHTIAATARTSPNHNATLHYNRTPGGARITLTAGDAGALFSAIGTTSDIANGHLVITATHSGGATRGRAVITDFRLRHAPVIAKILQGLSLYGVPAATSGPGLAITRLTAPFNLAGSRLNLGNGRAYSASLGFTTTGSIDLARKTYDLSGTIVPAYALNTLPGRIPLIGRLFSPEKGSGLFAARYSVNGPFANPTIVVNPLSALTPGFLRDIFGIFTPDRAKTP
ncbi:AsmA-like C-terminal region-containing protein [Acidiphilium sp.]|uniref:YhdP family protein n=1 Tax=Acidiphilium sp. TaxID=527 RepID=UPI003D03D33E